MSYKSPKQFIKVQKKLWKDFGGTSGVYLRALEGTIVKDFKRELHHKPLLKIDAKHALARYKYKHKCK